MADWIRSSRCESNSCVEVNIAEQVTLRDSTHTQLRVGREDFTALVVAIRAGRLRGGGHG